MTFTVVCVVIGVALLVPAILLLVRPQAMARRNDTTGPRWRVWNWNRAPGQVTKPWQMIVAGLVLLVVSCVVILVGLSRTGFSPLRLT